MFLGTTTIISSTTLSTKNVNGRGIHAPSKENIDDSCKAAQDQIERASCVQTCTNSWADITARNINLPIDVRSLPDTQAQDYTTDDDEGWTKEE